MTRLSAGNRRAGALMGPAGFAVIWVLGSSVLSASADPAPGPHSCAQHGAYYNTSDFVTGTVFSSQDVQDDGFSDLVEGAPGALSGVGAVDIHYDVQLSRVETGGLPTPYSKSIYETYFDGVTAAPGDGFGAASAFMYANAGYCADLAIGAPGNDAGRGKVIIGLGSLKGLDPVAAITITGASTGEHFGTAVVARGHDLWIGAPYRTVDGVSQAGAVDHYRVTAGSAALIETLTEASPGIAGSPEPGDHFGRVLAVAGHTLVIGEPAEDIGTKIDAGSVTIVTESPTTDTLTSATTLSQDSANVPGVAESYDHLGSSVSIDAAGPPALVQGVFIAVGVPGEDLGTTPDAGVVQAFARHSDGTVVPIGTVTQNTPGLPGVPESGDKFGSTVLVGGLSDIYYDGTQGVGDENIAVGVPGEDVGSDPDQGVVDIFAIRPVDSHPVVLARSTVFFEGPASGHVGGAAAAGDQFGAGLSAMPVDRYNPYGGTGGTTLDIAVPGKDVAGVVDAGEIRMTWVGASSALSGRALDSVGPFPGERYGVGASGRGGGVFVESTD